MEFLDLLMMLPLLGFVWPWQQVDPESGVVLDTSNEVMLGPYTPPNWDSGEFGPLQPVANLVSKVTKNVDRISGAASKDPSAQVQSPTLWQKVTGAATASSDFLSSTLYKIVIIVVVVAVFSLFFMSYIQAKGANLAK